VWLHEAQVIASVLEVEGIVAVIPDAHTLGVRPELATALGGVRVLVRASDLERANDVLAAVVDADASRPDDTPVDIRRSPIESDAAQRLIRALNAELSAIYPEPGANHFRLDPAEVAPGRGAFLVAYDGDRPIGCGAIRLLTPERAEVKRMYVDPEARGLGVGRRILELLEQEARTLGARQIVLETGSRQLAALALYERAGFRRIDEFGEYAGSPLSVCLAKTLS
jgi:GNAT superfamily N-acetyltransferase